MENDNNNSDELLGQLDMEIASLLRQLKTKRAEREFEMAKRNNSGVPRRFNLPEAIEKVFRETKTPMTSGQVTAAVRVFGFAVHKQAVSSTLVRYHAMRKRFERVAPGFYYLKEEEK